MSSMAGSSARRRPKVTVTLDAELLAVVDAQVASHPELDRSAVIDSALRLWRARQLELAVEEQFAQPDGTPQAERTSWDAVRRAATGRRLGRSKS